MREKNKTLHFDQLYEVIQKIFPEDLRKLASLKIHRHSFTWAKSLTFTTGNNQKSFDSDRA